MTSTQKKTVVVVAFLLNGWALPALAAQRPEDSTVSLWVKEALRDDPRVDSAHVAVSTNDGIATLSGEVRSLAAANYANQEAMKIDGVRGVINDLVVKPAYRPDIEIAADIRSRLTNSSSISSRGLDVEVSQGVATLNGTVDSWEEHQEAELLASEVRGVSKVHNELHVTYRLDRPDNAIRQDVIASIERDVYLAGLPITATVTDGEVTLNGTVGSAYEKDRAGNDARWVGNVKVLKNDLKVEWWENRGTRRKLPMPSDTELQKAVHDELYKDLRIEDPFVLTVKCSHGHTTLEGTVPSYYQKRLAEKDTRDVAGVGWVTNSLTVTSARRDDATIRTDVQSRLDSDYQLNGQDISVNVNDGVVTLAGNANMYDEETHALEVASRVPGVMDLVDDIHVDQSAGYTDTQLQQRVKDRLAEHAETRCVADRILTRVEHGTVTLTGDVYTWGEREDAARVAMRTNGVRAVDNRITVEGVSYPWDEWHSPVAEGRPYDWNSDHPVE